MDKAKREPREHNKLKSDIGQLWIDSENPFQCFVYSKMYLAVKIWVKFHPPCSPITHKFGIWRLNIALFKIAAFFFFLTSCKHSNPILAVWVWMCVCVFVHVLIGDKALDGYSKKKYVCKLLFIFLLGHDIDFGHMEAVNLLSSNKYTEKQIVSLSSYPFSV